MVKRLSLGGMDPLWVKEARWFKEWPHCASFRLYGKKGIEGLLTMRRNNLINTRKASFLRYLFLWVEDLRRYRFYALNNFVDWLGCC